MEFVHRLLLFLSAGSLLACCGPRMDRSVPVHLSAKDAGRMAELVVGQDMFLDLSSNPTTGFSWSFRCDREDILSALGEPEYKPDRAAPGIVGSGGTETFRFRGALPGTATLQFEYRRPWESDSLSARTLTFMVRVVQ
jgi:inhibitor of cysteine peptidase